MKAHFLDTVTERSFDFTLLCREVEPILEVLVGKTLEQSMMEVAFPNLCYLISKRNAEI
jgi:hypothetical protein